MIRTTLIVTVAAFFLSVVCLSAAIAIGGPEAIASGAWAWGPWSHVRDVHWSHTYSSDDDSSRREEAWSADKLVVNVPADVTFTQADGPGKIVIYGPRSVIEDLSLSGGALSAGHGRRGDYGDTEVRVEVTAPKITDFTVNGSGKLVIRNYNQDRLGLGVFGSDDVEVHGSTRRVELNLTGSGDADLGDLATDAAAVSISGSGNAKVRPKSWAKVDISGSGDVSLLSRPAHLESNISGTGTVNQDEAAPAPSEPETPRPPVKPGRPVKRT